MPIKQFKPTSPGRRNASGQTFSEITKSRPEKSLTESLRKKAAGRNNQGRITVRNRGGGARRLYRIIDWKREKAGVPARVVAIEYDPNRTARIALLQYADGEKRYILAPNGLAVGASLLSGPDRGSARRQHAPARQHAYRHAGPQHRDDARPRWPDGSQRRRFCPVDGEGRRLRTASPPQR